MVFSPLAGGRRQLRTGVAHFEHLSPGEIQSWDQVEHADGGSGVLSPLLTSLHSPSLIPWAVAQQGCRQALRWQQVAPWSPLTPTPRRKHKTSLPPFVLSSI